MFLNLKDGIGIFYGSIKLGARIQERVRGGLNKDIMRF